MEKQPGLTDWELNNLLYDVASSLDDRVFADMKCLCTGEGGIGRGDLKRLETPFEFFLHLRQMDMISKDNFLLLQALLSKVHRVDLREKAHHLAQIRGNILHFHKPKTNVEAINEGFQSVRLHVQGSFETYKRPALEELRKYVAKLLSVKEEFILICGVELEDGGSLILTFLIHKDYAKKLPQLFLEHSQEFSSRKVHNIQVDIPKEFDHDQGLSNVPNSLVRSHGMCAQGGHENSSSHGMNKDLHLLIVGKTGVGKSATCNSILGRKAFKSSPSWFSKTQQCQRDVAQLGDGRKIYVVDTPAPFQVQYSVEEGKELFVNEIKDAIAMNPLGYHAILLALRYDLSGRFTQEDADTLLYLKKLFGENFIKKHCIVIMTIGDLYKREDENVPFIDWCKTQNRGLKDLIEEVSGRVILFDNIAIINEKATQRQKLVEMVDRLVINGGRYTNEHFERARQKMEKTLEDKRDKKMKVLSWLNLYN